MNKKWKYYGVLIGVICFNFFLVKPSYSYTKNNDGTYTLTKAEMQAIVKKDKEKTLEIDHLKKKVDFLTSMEIEEQYEKTIEEYKELLIGKDMEINTLKDTIETLKASNNAQEKKTIIYEYKYKAAKTRAYTGWGLAIISTIGWIAK